MNGVNTMWKKVNEILYDSVVPSFYRLIFGSCMVCSTLGKLFWKIIMTKYVVDNRIIVSMLRERRD